MAAETCPGCAALTSKLLARKLEQLRRNLGNAFSDRERRVWIVRNRNPQRWIALVQRSLILLDELEKVRGNFPEHEESFDRLMHLKHVAARGLARRTEHLRPPLRDR